MNKFVKGLLVILLFGIMYVMVMLAAYEYLYAYPVGYLDEAERSHNALNYKLVEQVDVTKEDVLYFTRSNNSVGTDMHVGTLYCKYPNLVRNFFCEETSSIYFPINSYGYVSSKNGICYLFGATSDKNTVKVTITFSKSAEETKEFEMVYENGTFYYLNFDNSWASYDSHCVGYNKDGGITFQYWGEALSDGGYVEKDSKK